MSVLDTMMRLQAGYNGQEMEGIKQVGETLGGIIQNRGQRSFQQEALKFFTQNDVTPEKIQEFTSMYPMVNPAEVFQIAGTVAKEKESQEMKDVMKTISEAVSEGATFDDKLLATIMQKHPKVSPDKFMQVLTAGQQYGLNLKNLRKPNTVNTPQGSKTSVLKDDGTAETLIDNPRPEKEVKETPLDQAIKDMMTKVNPDTTEHYTAAEAYQAIVHPPKEKSEKIPNVQHIDLGDKTRIYENGVLKETVPKGKAPGANPEDKPHRVAYRDTATGAVNYYDTNNPKDRATLQQYGKQLVPILENPITTEVREALTPAVGGKSAYKSAEEVRSAYSSGKLTKDAAAKILRENFGMK